MFFTKNVRSLLKKMKKTLVFLTQNNYNLIVLFESHYKVGALAQLGERRAGSAKVRGSSPLCSIV